jgi:tetratricopeptide (TPR) repeat protein/transglutaminase-like putative cysteine protease
MRTAFAFVAAVLWAGCAIAADQPVYGPVPAWVRQVPIPKPDVAQQGAAFERLLEDDQAFYGLDGDQFYAERAVRIGSSEGLQGAGNLSLNWDPQTETLTIHRLNIIREGQVIDVLAKGQKFLVLRRENNLELAMLDGTLTATIQPEDLRVGDVVDLAFTRKRRDPVFQGRSEGFVDMGRPGVIGRMHMREVWPSSKPIRWQASEGLGTPKLVRSPDEVDLEFDEIGAEAPKPPVGAPARFSYLAELEVSQFSTWADVSTLMAPLYRKAATLSPTSPLRAEIDKIKAATADPKARAAAALRLVQDQTRYVFLGMNFGGYIPADADVTWTRRFGDCKGKTALLLALLQGLGIDAEPALVDSSGGDGLDERLPMLALFDHVLVRARIGGATYWLDGTRLGDRSLDDLKPPPFRWALPVQDAGGALERIDQPPLAEPEVDGSMSLDDSAGLDAPAPAHLEYVLRGDPAIALNLRLKGMTRADAVQALRQTWTRSYPWITIQQVDFTYDDDRAQLRLVMDGTAKLDWRENGPVREFEVPESLLGRKVSFKREPGPHQDAPYAIAHPQYIRWRESIVLPKGMTGFTLPGSVDVDKVIGSVAYRRTTRIENGTVLMESSQRTLAAEFPASEAESAAAALRELADTDVVVRTPRLSAQGAPQAQSQSPSGAPADAQGFATRGARYLSQGDLGRAIADFSRAAELDPRSGAYLYARGVAYMLSGQSDQALADFTQAMVLAPNQPALLMARAELYLGRGQDALAEQDFDAAAKVAPGDVTLMMRRIQDYDRAGRFDAAIRGLDQVIAQHPDGLQLDMLLNNRCWIRAKAGRELPLALADCDASLKLKPDAVEVLDSRGFVLLRMGRLDDAIASYDAALKLDPNKAESLYGRGLAKLRKGMAAEGQADVAAAARIDPKLPGQFAALGVRP